MSTTLCAQVDRVVAADLKERVLRHHAAVLAVVVAPPRQPVPLEAQAVFGGRRLQNMEARGDDFLADAVTRDDGDAIAGHVFWASRAGPEFTAG